MAGNKDIYSQDSRVSSEDLCHKSSAAWLKPSRPLGWLMGRSGNLDLFLLCFALVFRFLHICVSLFYYPFEIF